METLINYWVKNDSKKLDELSKLCDLEQRFTDPQKGESVKDSQKERIWSIIYKNFLCNKMSLVYRQEKSFNNIELDILKSGLQKYIRRGNITKAIWCGIELDLFAYSDDKRAEGIRTNFLHRLMIIFLEDVCNPNLFRYADKSIRELLRYREGRKGKDINSQLFRDCRKKEEEYIPKFIDLMCNSTHTRILSNYRLVISKFTLNKVSTNFWEFLDLYYPDKNVYCQPNKKISLKDFFKSIEDSVLNKMSYFLYPEEQTVRVFVNNFIGCLEDKDLRAFFWVMKIPENIKKIHPRNRKSKPAYLVFDIIEKFIEKYKTGKEKEYLINNLIICMRWYDELKTTREAFLTFFYMILLLVRKDEFLKESSSLEESKVNSKRYILNLTNRKIKINSYVLDMHTKKGRKEGFGTKEFALEGCFISNGIKGEFEVWESLYKDLKLFYSGGLDEASKEASKEVEKVKESKKDKKKIKNLSPEKESEFFEFKIRAQLTCAKHRPCTYFARIRNKGKNVFVKGPYKNEENASIPLTINKIKKLFKELNVNEVEQINLIPDMFPSVPLGIRSSLDLTEKYPFLVYKDLCNLDEMPSITKESKLWPETKVVNWNKITNCIIPDIKNLYDTNINLFKQYVIAILFRFIVGTSDLADRNFIIVNNLKSNEKKLYSIDEENINYTINFKTALTKVKCENILKYLKNNLKDIIYLLRDWKKIFENVLSSNLILDDNIKKGILERFDIVINEKELLKLFSN